MAGFDFGVVLVVALGVVAFLGVVLPVALGVVAFVGVVLPVALGVVAFVGVVLVRAPGVAAFVGLFIAGVLLDGLSLDVLVLEDAGAVVVLVSVAPLLRAVDLGSYFSRNSS